MASRTLRRWTSASLSHLLISAHAIAQWKAAFSTLFLAIVLTSLFGGSAAFGQREEWLSQDRAYTELNDNYLTAPAVNRDRANGLPYESEPRFPSTSTLANGPYADNRYTAPRYGRIGALDPPPPHRFERENFQFETPGPPWIVTPPTSAEHNYVLSVTSDYPEIMVLISAEPLGAEIGVDSHGLTKVSQNELQARFSGVVFTLGKPETNNGIPGIRYEASITADGDSLHATCWSAVHNGYAYQVTALGMAANSAAVNAAGYEMSQRIHLIDPQRVAQVEGRTVIQRFQSTRYGYQIDLTNLGWLTAHELTKEQPNLDFAAIHKTSVMMVTPLPVPGRCPDLELLGKMLLARLGFEYPCKEVSGCTPVQMGVLAAREYVIETRQNSQREVLVLRVAATENFAYIIMGRVAGGDAGDLVTLRQAMDRVHVDPKFLPANLQLTESERRAHSLMLNDLGIIAHRQGDLQAALDFCAGANTLNPRDEAMLSNRLDALSDLNRRAEAIALAEKELPNFPASEPLRITYAKILAKEGRPADARQVYRELLLAGCVDEETLSAYADLARDAGAHDEAIEVVTAFAARRPSAKIRTVLASLYLKKGDYDTAIAQLTQLQREHPADLDVASMLAFTYEDAGRLNDALAVTQPLIDSGCRDELIWILHGRTLLRLEQFAEAKRILERAAEINPTSEATRELLKTASNLLGQGENSSLKKAIAPVDIPEVVRIAIQQASVQPNKSVDRYGAEELVRITGVAYHRGQPTRSTESCRIKIHTTGAVAQYSTLKFQFKPTAERIFVNRLAVFDAAGQQVAEGNVDNYYVVDDDSSGLATNDKVVNIPMPALKPGHTIEYMVTREDRAPAEEFSFQRVTMSSDVPVGVCAMYVEGDVHELKYATSLPLKIATTGNVLHCVHANPPIASSESHQQSVERFLPIVWLGAADARWDQEAKSYLEFMNEKLVLDDSTRTLAQTLTKSCTTNRQKLAVLAAHVQSSCTYQGIEFGRRGRMPNTAQQTLELHYGDCKDHALLLKQLLAAVGIPANLAVVSSSSTVSEEVASLDQFDHMILFVPNESIGEPANAAGGLVIDVTEKDANPLLSPPFGLADKAVLVLDPERPRFVRTPTYPPDALQLMSKRRIAVREDSAQRRVIEATVSENLVFNSYMAPGVRGYLRTVEAGKRREAIQDLLLNEQHVRITRADVDNLEDTSLPLVLRLEYVLPDAFQRLPSSAAGNLLIGRLPAAWETRFLEADYTDARQTPFEIRMPRLVRTELQIELPPGFQLDDTERWNDSGQTPFVAWSSKTQTAGTTVHLLHAVRVPGGRYQASDYATYYADMKDSLSILQLPVMLRKPVLEASAARGTTRR